ncbi:hypothetical protein [Rhodoflexus caldus]|uniref:hypothetical protein n=1 Tax=Rhodoflexus caldus TaxID=2891236 RepID=UPI00202A6316|nr:hypothetical protein [Rhodoflexus caldus]
MSKKVISLRIDAGLHAKGKEKAAANRQKFNGYIESLIERDTRSNDSKDKKPEEK